MQQKQQKLDPERGSIGLEKKWLFSSRNSATPVYRLGLVLQLSAIKANVIELQYQTQCCVWKQTAMFF